MTVKNGTDTKRIVILGGIMIMAVAARFVGLDVRPAGVLSDEAYGAYNAYALLNYGVDSRGYVWPVYFVAWGSGMSVGYAYLAIPLFKLFGASILVYRIPQALVGVLSVYAAYVAMREMFDEDFGLFAAFVLALNPWHIMNTRYGLDANMAPGMFIIGLAFLLMYMNREKGRAIHIYLAAVFFGATLYCYALSWIMLPLFLGMFALCFRKRIRLNRHLWISVGILFVMAMPLLTFIAVNQGWLPEIKTSLFSVPRLNEFRGSELSLKHFIDNVVALKGIVVTGHELRTFTSSMRVGSYYYFTLPFLITGLIGHFTVLVRKHRLFDNDLDLALFLWLVAATIMSLLNENITIIHVNLLHMPIIFYGAYGIWQLGVVLAELLEKRKGKGAKAQRIYVTAWGLVWAVGFTVFLQEFLTIPMVDFYDERTPMALEIAKEKSEELCGNSQGQIVVYDDSVMKYSYLMWYEKFDPVDFNSGVIYDGESGWQDMVEYGRYGYMYREAEVPTRTSDSTVVYLTSASYRDRFEAAGYTMEIINNRYAIVY